MTTTTQTHNSYIYIYIYPHDFDNSIRKEEYERNRFDKEEEVFYVSFSMSAWTDENEIKKTKLRRI